MTTCGPSGLMKDLGRSDDPSCVLAEVGAEPARRAGLDRRPQSARSEPLDVRFGMPGQGTRRPHLESRPASDEGLPPLCVKAVPASSTALRPCRNGTQETRRLRKWCKRSSLHVARQTAYR